MTNELNEIDEILALDGGPPVRTGPTSAWPSFDDELIAAVNDVIRSRDASPGPGDECRRFEQEYALAIGARYAMAVASGEAALELALDALGIGPGDEVILPGRTTVGSANCVVMRGATPVFADVDRNSQTLTAESILAVLTPSTRAVIAVHLAGWPCDLDPILELARQRQFKVIEECSQAHHARYKGRRVGTIGDAGVFAFCQDKIMTTGGESGLMTTNNSQLWERCHALAVKMMRPEGEATDQPRAIPRSPHGHASSGRLPEAQAAMGRILLRRLPESVEARRDHAARLASALSFVNGLRIAQPPADLYHSFYQFYAFVTPEQLKQGWTRDRIIEYLRAEGVNCAPGFSGEFELEQAVRLLKSKICLPVASGLAKTSLVFMVHPTLTVAEIDETARAIQKVMRVAASPPDAVPQRAA